MTGVTDWAGKLPRNTNDPLPPPEASQATKVPKEKITSKVAILQDAGSEDWSVDISDKSMATTTATIRSRVSKGLTPLRAKINDNLLAKGKMNSIQVPVPISAPTMSQTSGLEEEVELPEDSIYPDMDEGMMEDLDTTLEEIQQGTRKRPRGLLLGKSIFSFLFFRDLLKLTRFFLKQII